MSFYKFIQSSVFFLTKTNAYERCQEVLIIKWMGIRIPLVIRNVQIVGVLTSPPRGDETCAPTVHWPPVGPRPGGNKANVAPLPHKKKINSDRVQRARRRSGFWVKY